MKLVGSIETIRPTIKWRDVIHLDIDDPVLKTKTIAFLDKLEKSSFLSKNSETGDTYEANGQSILQSIKAREVFLRENPSVAAIIRTASTQLGLDYVNGKITIGDHSRRFDGRMANGSNTAFTAMSGIEVPIGISIGQDYLKGARYKGEDSRFRPVTVEAVLANELAHVANRSSNNQMSDRVENVIVVALGGHPRKVGEERVDYRANQNGGYQSLMPSTAGRAKKVALLSDPEPSTSGIKSSLVTINALQSCSLPEAPTNVPSCKSGIPTRNV